MRPLSWHLQGRMAWLLILIAAGVGAVPRPGGLDDRAQVGVSRLPAKLPADFFRGGDKCRRVAGTAGAFSCRDLLPRNCFHRLDHFPNAVAPANAEVVVKRLARLEAFQRNEMSLPRSSTWT